MFDDERYIGIVIATDPVADEPWPHYTAKLAGNENEVADATDDWRAALEYLIDAASE